MAGNAKAHQASPRGHGLLGSLKDALAAASRDDQAVALQALAVAPSGSTGAAVAGSGATAGASPPPLPAVVPVATKGNVSVIEEGGMASGAVKADEKNEDKQAGVPSAEEAARAVRSSVTLKTPDRHVEFNEPPTTRVARMPAESKSKDSAKKAQDSEVTGAPRTQLVRGRQKLQRNDFAQDPVVGWLVVVGGPGLGAFRPVYEGNNTIGRAKSNRIAVDFGDDAISSEEQAYIRYDSTDRGFLFVPNLAKTNVVSVNDKRPTGAVELAHMDVITMGRTQLVFVPFCGADFDWAELAEVKD